MTAPAWRTWSKRPRRWGASSPVGPELDADRMLPSLLARAIEILGEATSRVSDDTRTRAADVPWRAIVAMRNRIVHACFDIDADIVWKTAVEEVPALLPRLRRVLEDIGGS